MSVPTMIAVPKKALINAGLKIGDNVHYQLAPDELTQQTISRGEGVLNNTGALVIKTGKFTGRSPKDRYY
jgi:phosphoenolpyruvate carboxykinase (ATP)